MNVDDYIMLLVLYINPLLFLLSGKLFRNKAIKRNPLFGYRISRLLENDTNWRIAQKLMYELLYKLGIFLLIISVLASLCLFVFIQNVTVRDYSVVGIMLFQGISLFWIIFKVENKLEDSSEKKKLY